MEQVDRDVTPRQVCDQFPSILRHMEDHLPDSALERLPEYHRLSLDE